MSKKATQKRGKGISQQRSSSASSVVVRAPLFTSIPELVQYASQISNQIKIQTNDFDVFFSRFDNAIQFHIGCVQSMYREIVQVVVSLSEAISLLLAIRDNKSTLPIHEAFLTHLTNISMEHGGNYIMVILQSLDFIDGQNGTKPYDANLCTMVALHCQTLSKLYASNSLSCIPVPDISFENLFTCLEKIFDLAYKGMKIRSLDVCFIPMEVTEAFISTIQLIGIFSRQQQNKAYLEKTSGFCVKLMNMLKLMVGMVKIISVPQYYEEITLLINSCSEISSTIRRDFGKFADWLEILFTVASNANRDSNVKIVENVLGAISKIAGEERVSKRIQLTSTQRQLLFNAFETFPSNSTVIVNALKAYIACHLWKPNNGQSDIEISGNINRLFSLLKKHKDNEEIIQAICQLIVLGSIHLTYYCGASNDFLNWSDSLLSIMRTFKRSPQTVGIIGEMLLFMEYNNPNKYVTLTSVTNMASVNGINEMIKSFYGLKTQYINLSKSIVELPSLLMEIIHLHDPASIEFEKLQHIDVYTDLLTSTNVTDSSLYIIVKTLTHLNHRKQPERVDIHSSKPKSFSGLAIALLDVCVRLSDDAKIVNNILSLLLIVLGIDTAFVNALKTTSSKLLGFQSLLRKHTSDGQIVYSWCQIVCQIVRHKSKIKIREQFIVCCDDILAALYTHRKTEMASDIIQALVFVAFAERSFDFGTWKIQTPSHVVEPVLIQLNKLCNVPQMEYPLTLLHAFMFDDDIRSLFVTNSSTPSVFVKVLQVINNDSYKEDLYYVIARMFGDANIVLAEYRELYSIVMNELRKLAGVSGRNLQSLISILFHITSIRDNEELLYLLSIAPDFLQIIVTFMKMKLGQNDNVISPEGWLNIIAQVLKAAPNTEGIVGSDSDCIDLLFKLGTSTKPHLFYCALEVISRIAHLPEVSKKLLIPNSPMSKRLVEDIRSSLKNPRDLRLSMSVFTKACGLEKINDAAIKAIGKVPHLIPLVVKALKWYKTANDEQSESTMFGICFLLVQLGTNKDNIDIIASCNGIYDCLTDAILVNREGSLMTGLLIQIASYITAQESYCRLMFVGKFDKVLAVMLNSIPSQVPSLLDAHTDSTVFVFDTISNFHRYTDQFEELNEDDLDLHSASLWQIVMECILFRRNIEDLCKIVNFMFEGILKRGNFSECLMDKCGVDECTSLIIGLRYSSGSSPMLTKLLIQLLDIVLKPRIFMSKYSKKRLLPLLATDVFQVSIRRHMHDSSIVLPCLTLLRTICRFTKNAEVRVGGSNWYDMVTELFSVYQNNPSLLSALCLVISSQPCIIDINCARDDYKLFHGYMELLRMHQNDKTFVKTCLRWFNSTPGYVSADVLMSPDLLLDLLLRYQFNIGTLVEVCKAIVRIKNKCLLTSELSQDVRLNLVEKISIAANSKISDVEVLESLISVILMIIDFSADFCASDTTIDIWLLVASSIPSIANIVTLLWQVSQTKTGCKDLHKHSSWSIILLKMLENAMDSEYQIDKLCEIISNVCEIDSVGLLSSSCSIVLLQLLQRTNMNTV